MSNKYPNCYPKVILLGDSLTEFSFNKEGNWGGKLNELLRRRSDVINRGYGGYNSLLLKLVVPKILNRENLKDVACVTIMIGTNDSCRDLSDKPFSIPIEKYEQNLAEMVNYLVENGLSKDKILFITPPSMDLDGWVKLWEGFKKEHPDMGIDLEKSADFTKKYVDSMIKVGEQLNITTVNIFDETNKEENIKKSFIDGIHFSEHGATIVFDLIKDEVEKRVEKFRNTKENNFPECLNIDFDNIEDFF